MDKKYTFTEKQLWAVLRETIELYEEYQMTYGKSKVVARLNAISETIEGLDAEIQLIGQGEKITPTVTVEVAA